MSRRLPILALLVLATALSAASAQTVTYTRKALSAALSPVPTQVVPLRDGRLFLLSYVEARVFDPATGTVVATLTSPVTNPFAVYPTSQAVLLANGQVQVSGGCSPDPSHLTCGSPIAVIRDSYIFSVTGNTITASGGGLLFTPRSGHHVLPLSDGRVVVVGGTYDINTHAPVPAWPEFFTSQDLLFLPENTTLIDSHAFAALLPSGDILIVQGVAGSATAMTASVAPGGIHFQTTSPLTALTGTPASLTLLGDGRALVTYVNSTASQLLTIGPSGVTAAAGPKVIARGAAQSVRLGDGSALIVGAGQAERVTAATSAVIDATGGDAVASVAPTPGGGAVVCCDATGRLFSYEASGGTTAFTSLARVFHGARADVAGALLGDGRVVSVNSSNIVDVYDPATGVDQSGSLPSAAAGRSAVSLGNGRVLVTNGAQTSNLLLVTSVPSGQAFQVDSPVTIVNGPSSTRRARPAVLRLSSGKVIIAGGGSDTLTSGDIPAAAGANLAAGADVYDPVAGTDSVLSGWNVDRYGAALLQMPNGLVYYIGGFDGHAPTATVMTFDPSAGTMSTAGHLNSPRFWHTATAIDATHILVAGGLGLEQGTGNPAVLGSLELYDVTTNTSATLSAPLAHARYGHAALLEPDGTVLVAGGFGGSAVAEAEVYDPVQVTTTPLGAMDGLANSNAIRATLVVTPNGQTVLIQDPANGGDEFSVLRSHAIDGMELAIRYQLVIDSLLDAVTSLYDSLRALSWTTSLPGSTDLTHSHIVPTGAMSTVRQLPAAVRLADGRVLVAGGTDVLGNALQTAETYDPSTGMFAATGSMTSAHGQPVGILLSDGRALIGGGGTNSDLFDPASKTFTSVTGAVFNSATSAPPHLVTLADGRTLVMRGGTSALQLFDPWTMRVITLGPSSVNGTGGGAALQANGDVVFYGGASRSVSTPPTPPTDLVWRLRDVPGAAATVSHSGGYTSTTTLTVTGLAPGTIIYRNNAVYVKGLSALPTVSADSLPADANGTTTVTLSGAIGPVSDAVPLRFVPKVSASATGGQGATTLTLSALTPGVSVHSGDTLEVGSALVTAAADAAANASGSLTLTLTAPLAAGISGTIWINTVADGPAPARTGAGGADVGSGRLLVGGGTSFSGQFSSSGYADRSLAIYDPAFHAFSTLPALLPSGASNVLPFVRLGDGRIFALTSTVLQIVDLAAGTVTVDGLMPVTRNQDVAVQLTDGRVLIVGGTADDPSTSKQAFLWLPSTSFNEVYNPQLVQQLADASSQIAALNATVAGLNTQIATLQAQVNTIPGLQQQVDSLTSQLAAAQAQIQQAQAQAADLQSQLTAANAQNAQLQTTNGGLVDRIAQLQQQLAAAQQSLQTAQTQLQSTQAELQQSQSDLAVASQAVATRDATIATLNGSLSVLVERNQQLQQDKTGLQAQVTALTADKAALQAQVDALTAQNGQLQQQVAELTADDTGLQQQVNGLAADKTVLQAQVTTLTDANVQLHAQVAQLTADETGLQQHVDILTADKTALQQQVNALTTQNANLQAQVTQLSADKSGLQAQVATLTAASAQLQAEIASLTQQIAAMQTTVSGEVQTVSAIQQVLVALPGGVPIPGATPADQLANLSVAIKSMPQGSQIQLLKTLTGKK